MTKVIDLESIILNYENGRKIKLTGDEAKQIGTFLFGNKKLKAHKLNWEILSKSSQGNWFKKLLNWSPYGN